MQGGASCSLHGPMFISYPSVGPLQPAQWLNLIQLKRDLLFSTICPVPSSLADSPVLLESAPPFWKSSQMVIAHSCAYPLCHFLVPLRSCTCFITMWKVRGKDASSILILRNLYHPGVRSQPIFLHPGYLGPPSFCSEECLPVLPTGYLSLGISIWGSAVNGGITFASTVRSFFTYSIIKSLMNAHQHVF